MPTGARALGVAAGTALLLLVFAAQAAATSVWDIEFTKMTSGQSESIACKRAGEANLRFRAGALLPPPENEFDFTATGAECVAGSITQKGTEAVGSLKLKLTGLSVMKPSGCNLTSFASGLSALKFAPLKIGATEYKKLEPAEGTTTFTFSLQSCFVSGFNGTYKVIGSLCGKGKETGAEFVEQKVVLSAEVQAVGGCSLKIGSVSALMEGELS